MGESQKLKNHNIVYILGAGASVDAGMPVVANFLHRMRDSLEWLEEEKRQREVVAVSEVLKFRHEIAAAAYRVKVDPENIEELFSLAAAAQEISLMENVNIAIAATLDYSRFRAEVNPPMAKLYVPRSPTGWTVPAPWQKQIAETTVTHVQTANGPVALPVPPNAQIDRLVTELTYAYLTTLVWPTDERRHVTIITFNYDLVAETMLDSLGLPWNYGFIDKNDDQRPDGPECITLLKLHGSINWYRPKDSKGKLTGGLETPKTYEEVLSAGAAPFIIPPTWQKTFADFMALVWDDAVQAITNATRLGILGFSLPESDTHFKYLLAAGLRNNISLRRVAFATQQSALPVERLWRILRPELDKALVTTVESSLANFAFDGGLQAFLGLDKPQATVAIPARSEP
jgi:hypothetical protein